MFVAVSHVVDPAFKVMFHGGDHCISMDTVATKWCVVGVLSACGMRVLEFPDALVIMVFSVFALLAGVNVLINKQVVI